METTQVQKLARVLRVLVVAVFLLNLYCLTLVPGLSILLADGGPNTVMEAVKAALDLPGYEGMGVGSLPAFFLRSLWGVWWSGLGALLTLFFWLCGTCTAVILWQAKRVLDTVLQGNPFQRANAGNLGRAAVCCWIISGVALVRLILWLWAEQTLAPLFTYKALIVPAFFMGGLLFQVMSALFRQAAELKEDQDLTI